jgi:hypothetical protein
MTQWPGSSDCDYWYSITLHLIDINQSGLMRYLVMWYNNNWWQNRPKRSIPSASSITSPPIAKFYWGRARSQQLFTTPLKKNWVAACSNTPLWRVAARQSSTLIARSIFSKNQ